MTHEFFCLFASKSERGIGTPCIVQAPLLAEKVLHSETVRVGQEVGAQVHQILLVYSDYIFLFLCYIHPHSFLALLLRDLQALTARSMPIPEKEEVPTVCTRRCIDQLFVPQMQRTHLLSSCYNPNAFPPCSHWRKCDASHMHKWCTWLTSQLVSLAIWFCNNKNVFYDLRSMRLRSHKQQTSSNHTMFTKMWVD